MSQPPVDLPIRLHDTRRRAVVPFEPLVEGKAGIYTCGPTVYGPQHLGNMRSQLMPDLLRRVLDAAGHDVTYVTNVTDVGHLVSDADEGADKVEAAAEASGETVEQITGRWTAQWADDRRRLGCLEPDAVPRATDHIDGQIDMVRTLEAKGHTYRIDDGIYFDVSTFGRYAEFAHLNLDDLEATGRVENVGDKRHPADFALWKLTPPGVARLQEWDSPWGRGFPGWHIECSVMATAALGTPIDIHTGGIDHVRVHHTNEIAQSECALDVHPWVGIWMHNEFLDLGGEKMSKSKGHVLTVDSLVERGIDPLAFRYFFLQAHYRQQQAFTFELVEAAGTALRRLRQHAVAARDEVGGDPAGTGSDRAAELRAAFWEALVDDLNAPRALAVVSTVARAADLGAADRWSLLADFDRALGFGLADAVAPDDAAAAADLVADPRIADLLAARQAARAAKDFAAADEIRDQLAAEGLEIVDTPDGPQVRRR
ncbi:MAG: cysteine--tRNA ligase [Acidimicrobiales bacterium]|nr:cysteine--tRNA ligase [Acidimicrobiales bacterium]